ncbi:hypothetical protein J2S05_000615 [Alkalicoccobacillus murimartini]|uniref:Uncharacterized protein n=1 Tax=Alkalicoccobacillus murimartini TaxID=171685 RepID=A0ABT9YDN3_9BACI|nr:hypothetical protein [Alkalicoccobacillus murimartini]
MRMFISLVSSALIVTLLFTGLSIIGLSLI